MSVDYCVQLKDETAEHKIYPRTLAHCVLDDDGKTILELMKELLGDTSLAFNELVQEANQTTVSPTVFSELISLLSETLIRVFYSDTRPANPDLGEMWYNTSENKLYQFTAEGYVVRDTIDLRDALKVINPHFYRELINIHISDRSPTHNIGDLWVTDTIKQSRIDTTLGPGWYSVDDYHFGRSNLLRYTKEYDPAKYSKWVDKSQSTSTSAVYQTLYDFGVQRIEQRDQAVAQSVKLEPGKYYCMSAYVKSESALKPATLKPVIDETYGTIEMSNFVRDSQLSTEYTRVYFVFRTYSTCTYMMPRFSSNLDNPYLIYGLQLERGTEPTDWNPNPLDVLDKIKEYRLVCQEQRDLYYKNIPISEDNGDLAYDVENSKIYEYMYNWRDITSNNLISAFEYLNANEEYEKITAYARVEAPSTHNDGDLWLKIDTGDLYQWSDKDDIWVTANTEILPTIMTKIRTALKTTSEMEGLLDDMDKVIVEKVTEAVSEMGSDYILDAVRESSLYKDPETGETLMERMKSAEEKITADAIVNTVKENTTYAKDLTDLQNEMKEAKQEITADAIMQKVSKHETYQTDLASKNKTYSQSAAPTSGMIEGDLWIDVDDGNKLYRYDADTQQWRSIQDTQIDAAKKLAQQALDASGGGVLTYYGEETPTDPSEGTLWVCTTSGSEGLYRYDGSQWIPVNDTVLHEALQLANNAQSTADGKIKTFCQSGEPTSDMSEGDLWIDSDDGNKMYRYDADSSKWISIQDSRISAANALAQQAKDTADSKIATFYGADTPSDAESGDLWVRTTSGSQGLYRYSGSAWTKLNDAVLYDAMQAAGDAQATADKKILTFCQDNQPTSGMSVGDLWIDTNDGNKMYRYNGTSWVNVQDTSISSANSLAQQALSTAQGKITTHYGDTTPTSPVSGDLWVRTSTGNKGLWRYNGSTWTKLNDDVLYDAMQAAGDAKAIADSKILTFCQSSAPTSGMSVGDLWIDTDDNNKMYRYSGTSWVDIRDTHLDNEVSGIKSRLTTAEQKITDDAIVSTVTSKITYLDKLSSMVSSVQIEYYLADPSYTPTGNETSGWSTTVTWSSDKYVWSRTVTTLTSGSKTYSKPTCVSGVQDIPDGLTIKSIEPQYCSYASETEAPPSDHEGWVDSSDTSGTESDSTVTMYTWSRSKITYSDDSVAYSDPYYDVSLNRLSDIEEQYSTQMTQLSDSIELKVSYNDLDTMMKLEDDGLHLKKSDSSNEVVIDEDSVDIRTGGTTYSSFGTGYVQFGNYTIREGKDGGLVFVYDKK